MVKLFSSEIFRKAADKALQIRGGMGYIKEYPTERLYRLARATTIGEGTSEIQRIVIERRLLEEGPLRFF